MNNATNFHKENGNTVIIVLLSLLVIGLGAYAFFGAKSDAPGEGASAVETASGEKTPNGDAAQPASQQAAAPVIKPGNPVVAKVGGKDIARADVLNFIQTLPPQTRQMPIEQIFPLALDQLINTQVIESKTGGINLDRDPDVQKQLALAKQQIVRSVYLQKEVEKKIDDQKLKNLYDQYVQKFPDVQEVKAGHILVKEESKAKDLIEKLNGGADFAQLAKDNSLDGTSKNGGDLGYFTEADVVPAFAKVAFATEPGTYTKTPVKTDFGYHIIRVEDKRKRQPPEFETAKPMLAAQARRAILESMINDWRKDSSVEMFDINGDKIEPASGAANPAAAK